MPSSILNSDDGVISGTSGLKSTGGDDAVLLIQTKGTTAQTIDAGQRTKFPTTIGVGNATPSTSGSGISFPATQSASTDANTLDDYEEGTWTPVVSDSTNNATMAAGNGGKYTKIGNMVHIRGYVEMSSKGSISGSLRITGLPFTIASGNASYAGTTFGFAFNVAITAGQSICAYGETNQSYLQLHRWSSSSGTEALTATQLNNTSAFILDISYNV